MANVTIGDLTEKLTRANDDMVEIQTAGNESRRMTMATLLTGIPTDATLSEIDTNVNDLITLTGVAENATSLGTFTGTTISDSSTIKTALQALETAVESGGGGGGGTDDITNESTVSGTTASDALETLASQIAGFTAISGSTAVGSWVQPANNTFAAFTAAVAAAQGSATITGVYLKAGAYDWSASTNHVFTGNPVYVWAEPEAVISMPGANQTLTADLFLVRTNLFWTGAHFQNGGNIFSLRDLNTRVERIEIDGLTGSQLGSVLYHDSTTKNASADLGHVRVSRCTVDNCNSFIHLRSGTNAINSAIQADYIEIWGNTAKILDKYGVVINRDDPPTNGAWEKNSFAHIHHNHIEDLQGRSGSTFTGWGINSTYRRAVIENNILINVINGQREDVENVYSKSESALIQGNIIWITLSSGSQTQGMITGKGESQGAQSNSFIVRDNFLICNHPNVVNAAFWLQTSNVEFYNNVVQGPFIGGAINCQTTFTHRNVRIRNNKFYCSNNPGNGGVISIVGHFPRLQIEGNTFEFTTPSGTTSAIQVRSGSTSGLAVDDALIANNKVYNLNTATTVRVVELWKQAGSMLDPTIKDNFSVEAQTFLHIQTGVVNGKIHVKDNIARNRSTTLTSVSNGGSNTILQLRNSWQSGES